MNRRFAIRSAVQAIIGMASAARAVEEKVVGNFLSSVPTPDFDPYRGGLDVGGDRDETQSEARYALDCLYDAQRQARTLRKYDHDIYALRSCSNVYKAALQADREKTRSIERIVRSFKGNPADIIKAANKILTSLS